MTARCEEDFAVKLEGKNVKLQKVEGKRKRRKKHGVRGNGEWKMPLFTVVISGRDTILVTCEKLLDLGGLPRIERSLSGKDELKPIPADLYRAIRDSQLIGKSSYSKESVGRLQWIHWLQCSWRAWTHTRRRIATRRSNSSMYFSHGTQTVGPRHRRTLVESPHFLLSYSRRAGLLLQALLHDAKGTVNPTCEIVELS
ncbi:hypothetical protein JHK87_000619 [Glycine soja]|nr:hypothetical protein JHK87_000619 [Glycine soja]